MNRIVAVVILAITGTMSYGQDAVDSAYNNSHYQRRMAFFEQVRPPKKAIVFLGNSITESGDWSDILPGKYILNRGISGDITYGVVARLDEILRHRPAKIFLLIGVNDLKRKIPNELIIENYKRIVDIVQERSPKTKLYLQSLLPLNVDLLIEPFKEVKTENIDHLNSALKAIANENGLAFIDLSKVLADDDGQLKSEFTPDGIHLRPVAFITWVQYLKDLNYL